MSQFFLHVAKVKKHNAMETCAILAWQCVFLCARNMQNKLQNLIPLATAWEQQWQDGLAMAPSDIGSQRTAPMNSMRTLCETSMKSL